MTEKCVKSVNRGDSRWPQLEPCGRKAATRYEGKPYCKIHDPVTREAKWDAKMEKWREESRIKTENENWERAACSVCSGVDRQTLERLGSGWLAKKLEE
jgi:hypothetical protein